MNTNLAIVPTPSTTLASGEDTDYSTAKISNGYGLITTAGVSVQKGVTANITVDMKVKTLTVNTVTSWLEDNKSAFSASEWSSLSESHSCSGAFGWLFGGSESHYKNTAGAALSASTSQQQGFLKSLHQQQESNVHVTGTIQAVGQSFIPVEGFVYVEVTTITFSDNTSMTVVNTNNPVVADASGNTNGVKTGSGQLQVLPIGS